MRTSGAPRSATCIYTHELPQLDWKACCHAYQRPSAECLPRMATSLTACGLPVLLEHITKHKARLDMNELAAQHMFNPIWIGSLELRGDSSYPQNL